MTGSSYIPIVVPIMAFLAMGAWLGMVFYADRSPGKRRAGSKAGPGGETLAADSAHAPAAAPALDGPADSGPIGPFDHERIDEEAPHPALR